MIKPTKLGLPWLDGFALDGVQGDVMLLPIPAGYKRSTCPHYTIFSKGAIKQKGNAGTTVVNAGATSAIVLNHPLNEGDLVRTVTTPLFRYYCLSDPQKRIMEVVEVRLNSGGIFTVQPGFGLFVGKGSVLVNSVRYPDPVFIDAVTNPCTLVGGNNGAVALDLKRPT